MVKAPTASMGIPMNMMKRSLTIKLIRIKLSLVRRACTKCNKDAPLEDRLTIAIYYFYYRHFNNNKHCVPDMLSVKL